MKQSSICIVIPYFGCWPSWMPFFVLTCAKNTSINWLIYSDCGEILNCPPNISVVETSYKDYCNQVSNALGINFHPQNAYKLCDIKPCLGLIHQAELIHFDFWAFGDIDVVYGNLRKYFTEDRLAKKDLFSTHARRLSGHLCIIRNTDKMRSAFKRVVQWQQLLENDAHVAFDEKAFSKLFLRHKNSPKWYQAICRYFDRWLGIGEFVEAYTTPNAKVPWIDGTMNFPERWTWQDGALTDDLNQDWVFPYFHFLSWKKAWNINAIPTLVEANITQFSLKKTEIYF